MKVSKANIFFAIILIMFFFQNTFAFSDAHRKSANQLLDTMDLNRLLAGSIDAILQLELSKNPTLKPFEKTMKAFFSKYMSGESLREDFVDIYVETFTENELNLINAFYSTPTGKKALRETPNLMAKGAKLGEQKVLENISELRKMIEAEAKRLQTMEQNKE